MTLNVTPSRFGLMGLVIAALAITMGLAVSWYLTTAVSSWDRENVATIVRGELGKTDTEQLFRPSSPETGRARWQELMSEVSATIPGVVRCKVWSHLRVVLWSDDAALIGRQASNDPDLHAALAGNVVFRLVEPDRDDTEAAWRSQVLSRIYVPISASPGAAVRGVIELRKIPTRLAGNLTVGLLIVWAIAGAGALGLWLVVRPLASARRAVDAGAAAGRSAEEIVAEIRARFGFLPPFFEPALEAPGVLENLWQQTLSAYVRNPLPALFKEKVSPTCRATARCRTASSATAARSGRWA